MASQNYMSVSRMPWIPANIGTKKLEESFFFKEIMMVAGPDKGRLGLQLQWILNQTFPYLLPKRYHQMDIRALIEESSSEGSYWPNACFYLLCTQAHGSLFMNAVYELLRTPKPDFKSSGLKPCISVSSRKCYLDGCLDLCSSADEILFEPWLILQLPYNAGLLQQWLVVYTAELYRYQVKVAEFYYLPIPSDLRPVVKGLLQLHTDLSNHFMAYVRFLKVIIEMSPKASIGHLEPIAKDFWPAFCSSLPKLKFILSKKCWEIINVLKTMINGSEATENKRWNMEPVKHTDVVEFTRLSEIDTVFAYKYWLKDNLSIPTFAEKGNHLFIEEDCLLPYELELKNISESLDKAELLTFISDYVIIPGKLSGAPAKDMLDELANASAEDFELMGHCYLMYHHFESTCSDSEGVRDLDSGVIHQLNSLYSDVQVTAALAALTAICEHIINSKGNFIVYTIMKRGFPGVKIMPVKSMMNCLDKVHKDESWSFDKILEVLRKDCNKGSRFRFEYPTLESGIERVVQILEARIKFILLRMIEGYMEQSKDLLRMYGEMPVVQYLLPCFVASFIEIYNEQSVSKEAKRQYLCFVHEMIKSFEKCEYYEIHKPNHQVNITTVLLANLGQDMMISLANGDLFKIFRKVLSHLPQKLCNNLQDQMRSMLFQTVLKRKQCLNYNINGTSFSWPLQLYLLLRRTISALEVTSPDACSSADLTESNRFMVIFFTKVFDEMQIRIPKRDAKLTEIIFENAIMRLTSKEAEEKASKEKLFLDTTFEQLVGIILFIKINNLHKAAFHVKREGFKCVSNFFLDPMQSTYFSLLEGDKWRVKLSTSRWLSSQDGRKQDLSIITLEEARKRKECYRVVLDSLTKDGNVPMVKPGQVTFCPIQHCRWCGKAEGVDEFKLCVECLESPEYPDKNYYCSNVCMEAMKEQHIEEHVQFCLLKSSLYRPT